MGLGLKSNTGNPPIERRSSNYFREFKSPIFNFSNTATILTTARLVIDYYESNTATQKYGSFNYVRVVNNSAQDIILYPNQDTSHPIFIPADNITTLDSTIIPNTTSLLIVNNGSGTIAVSEIQIQIWKDLTDIQTLASNLHKRLFGVGLGNVFKSIKVNSQFQDLIGAKKQIKNIGENI